MLILVTIWFCLSPFPWLDAFCFVIGQGSNRNTHENAPHTHFSANFILCVTWCILLHCKVILLYCIIIIVVALMNLLKDPDGNVRCRAAEAMSLLSGYWISLQSVRETVLHDTVTIHATSLQGHNKNHNHGTPKLKAHTSRFSIYCIIYQIWATPNPSTSNLNLWLESQWLSLIINITFSSGSLCFRLSMPEPNQ